MAAKCMHKRKIGKYNGSKKQVDRKKRKKKKKENKKKKIIKPLNKGRGQRRINEFCIKRASLH